MGSHMHQQGGIQMQRCSSVVWLDAEAYKYTRWTVVGTLVVLEHRQAEAVERLRDAPVSVGRFVPKGLVGGFGLLPHSLFVGLEI